MRKIQNADLGTIETILDKYVTSPRTMCWTLSRLSAMGGEGVSIGGGMISFGMESGGGSMSPEEIARINAMLAMSPEEQAKKAKVVPEVPENSWLARKKGFYTFFYPQL